MVDTSKIGSSKIKSEIENFNGKENFSLWQKRMKALLVQQGFHKTLQDKSVKPAGTSNENWEEMDLKPASMIQLYLVDEVMCNVMDKEMNTKLWSRLEMFYMTKSFSNKLYLKE